MSFYIRNILTERDMQEALSTDKLLVIRFGKATDRYTKWIDQMLEAIYEAGPMSILVAACEISDMSKELLSKYSLKRAYTCAFIFFYRKKPISITFNNQETIVIVERISEYGDLISLLLFVQRSTLHGHKVPDLSFFFNFLSMKQNDTPQNPSSKSRSSSRLSWND